MCPGELAAAITALAVSISRQLPARELAVLAAAIVQLGETLETIVVQREYLESSCAQGCCKAQQALPPSKDN